jgi:hypothetical protein
MPTIRTKVTMDFEVPDDTDPDEFHDELRKYLEDETWYISDEYALESVRDIEVTLLDD